MPQRGEGDAILDGISHPETSSDEGLSRKPLLQWTTRSGPNDLVGMNMLQGSISCCGRTTSSSSMPALLCGGATATSSGELVLFSPRRLRRHPEVETTSQSVTLSCLAIDAVATISDSYSKARYLSARSEDRSKQSRDRFAIPLSAITQPRQLVTNPRLSVKMVALPVSVLGRTAGALRTSGTASLTRQALKLTSSAIPRTAFVRRLSTSPSVAKMSSTPYKVIHTTEAPGAVAPYSQAVVHNGVAYVSGCIPFTPEMKLVEGGIEQQTEQALSNLFAVVKAAGSDPSHILKCTIFMKDMANFEKINAIYEKRFAPYKPARSAVEVSRLPKDVGVEIECIAAVKANL